MLLLLVGVGKRTHINKAFGLEFVPTEEAEFHTAPMIPRSCSKFFANRHEFFTIGAIGKLVDIFLIIESQPDFIGRERNRILHFGIAVGAEGSLVVLLNNLEHSLIGRHDAESGDLAIGHVRSVDAGRGLT